MSFGIVVDALFDGAIDNSDVQIVRMDLIVHALCSQRFHNAITSNLHLCCYFQIGQHSVCMHLAVFLLFVQATANTLHECVAGSRFLLPRLS